MLHHWLYMGTVEAFALGWVVLLFFETAPGVPASSPSAIPFSWTVGALEAAAMLALAVDIWLQLVVECHARPFGARVERIASAFGGRAARPSRPFASPAFSAAPSPGLDAAPLPASPPLIPVRRVDSVGQLGIELGESDLLPFQDKLWDNVAFLVLLLGIAEWLSYYAGGVTVFRVSRPLRPLLLVAKSPDLRRSLAVIARTFAAIGRITSLFALLLLFYAVLGCQVFSPEQVSGYSLENDNFGSFSASALTMFVLQSTENFPDVMYPALDERPVVAVLFFISGLYAFAWVITPLLLAVQYEHYQSVMETAARAQRAKSYVPMLAAYKCVARAAMLRRARGGAAAAAAATLGPGTTAGAAATGRVEDLRTDNPSDEETFSEFLWRAKGVRRQAARALFKALDVEQEASSDRMVTAAEFLVLPQFLRLSPPGMRSNSCQQCHSCRPGRLLCCYTHGQRVRIREAARQLLRHPITHWVVVAAVVMSAVVACWWSWPAQRVYDACVEANGRAACWNYSVMVEEYAALAALSVGVLEIALRVVATGGPHRWIAASSWNTFDFVVTAWSWGASLAIAMGAKQALPAGSTDFLEITRAARVLRVLSVVPELRDFVDFVTAGRTVNIPRTALVFAILTVCVMLAWSVVGQELFGAIPGTSTPDGQIYTFRSLGYALLDMTQVLAVNNWNSIMYPVIYKAAAGPITSWFFVSFFFVGSMVLTNCVSGIIIDYYAIAKADAERERIQQSLFTGLGGEDDDAEDEGEDGYASLGDGGHHGIVDPIGRIAPPALDVVVRTLFCCATPAELDEDLSAAARRRPASSGGAMPTTADAIVALPSWLLSLLCCSQASWRRITRVCGVPVACCCGAADSRRSGSRRLRKTKAPPPAFHSVAGPVLSDSLTCLGVMCAPCCCRWRDASHVHSEGVSARGSLQSNSEALLSAGAGPAAGRKASDGGLQPVAGLGALSHKVVREYVASLRQELREDIESQSPPRLWRLLRRQRKRALRRARAVAAGRPGAESDSSDDDEGGQEDSETDDSDTDGDDDVWDADGDGQGQRGRYVLSEAQALLLRQELGADVFDDL
ncbi:hypothetical protein FNF31_04831 [Cafeteria roenbergensis]|uniref:Ion transport domain-containing protein n=1 Tax=Cafeteria roenbergensis TaxID=33653 RepID=A0A5A8D2N6_CAFRO|nr:hypothetical protein FNF31_04831 [Cafeteria roenbergensis]